MVELTRFESTPAAAPSDSFLDGRHSQLFNAAGTPSVFRLNPTQDFTRTDERLPLVEMSESERNQVITQPIPQ